MTETNKENLHRDLAATAALIDVKFDGEKTSRILDVFEVGFTAQPVEMRTTTKPAEKRGLSYRFVDFAGQYDDPLAVAIEAGMVDGSSRVATLAREAAQGELMGWGVDAEVSRGIEKIWPFLGKSRSLADVRTHLPSIPDAVVKSIEPLLEHGMRQYSIVAADFEHETCNLYFPLQDRSSVTLSNFRSLAEALGLQVDAGLLEYMTHGLFANFTYNWKSDEVQRFCVYVPAPTPADVPSLPEPIPSMVAKAPFASETRAFIMGPTLTRGEPYVKIETDWSGTIMGVFQQCMAVHPY